VVEDCFVEDSTLFAADVCHELVVRLDWCLGGVVDHLLYGLHAVIQEAPVRHRNAGECPWLKLLHVNRSRDQGVKVRMLGIITPRSEASGICPSAMVNHSTFPRPVLELTQGAPVRSL